MSDFPTKEHIAAAQEAANYWKEKADVYVWPSVTLAQAAIESANWTKLSGVNNGFGIKATPAQVEAGEATYLWTHEVIKGETVKVKQWFANYASLRDAYIAHAKLLATGKPYAEARKATTPQEFIRIAGKKYATAPDYAAVIISVMDRDGLYRYDKAASAPSATKPHVLSTPGVGAAVGGLIGGAGVVVTQAAQHVPVGMIVAFAFVAAIAGALVFLSSRNKKAPVVTPANTAAAPAAPQPGAKPAPPVANPIAPAPASPVVAAVAQMPAEPRAE